MPRTDPTTARCPSGWFFPATRTMSSPLFATLPRIRRSSALPRRRYFPCRTMLQCRGGARLPKHMGNILEIDPERRIARVQPGVVLDHLRNAAEKHHLTFAPDPASHDRCTIGGMIGNNSCGVHSVMAGKTDDNIEALEVVTYDGIRLSVGAEPRRPAHLSEANGSASMPGGPARSSADRATQISTALKQIADQYAESDPPKIPQHPPPSLRLQPELPAPRERLPHRPRPGRLRRHLRHHSRSNLSPRRKPSATRPAGRRLSRHLSVRRPHSRNPRAQTHRPRRFRRPPRLLQRTKGINRRRPRAASRGRRMAPGRIRRPSRSPTPNLKPSA